MKLIHTADVHLDTSYAGERLPPETGNRLRDFQRGAFEAIVSRARTWPADALLIAGDLFEAGRVTRSTIRFLQDRFASIPNVAVAIAPGNHDPFTADSPYALEEWPDNVMIFREPKWRARPVPGIPLTIHGFAYDGPQISRSPWKALRVSGNGHHVGIGHGSAEGHLPHGQKLSNPFPGGDAAGSGLAFLGLGHYHAYIEIPESRPCMAMYPGPPQPFRFDQPVSGSYIEAEISGANVRCAAVSCRRCMLQRYVLPCDGVESAEQVIGRVRGLGASRDVAEVAQVILTGPWLQSFDLGLIRDACEAQFEDLALIDARQPPIVDAPPGTGLNRFTANIRREIGDETDPDRRRLLRWAYELGRAACSGERL